MCIRDRNWLSGSTEEDFLNSSMYFGYFCNYLPLEKGRILHLNKLESPLLKDALCQVWLKLAQWFWRRWKCEKFTDRRTDRQTDDGQQVIRKAQLSFQLRWAKMVKINMILKAPRMSIQKEIIIKVESNTRKGVKNWHDTKTKQERYMKTPFTFALKNK